ncbi:tRNA (adenosine(37)-N6)-threonylcarbamoyltransferase complex dimerization subunit type 1 TsaB [Rhabdaerophilum sp. SD176]|uniref:tRNA (adenosine(37)-N6)-threonylcarbamoyltransferase complex dimerization subunit type 1 TsaB n=1 Tax=Rhabdaerophilum sp. SD176 TaxID=2983548 RepID=UPI0024DF4200|nr:tRNA (adenosine(37)-N6)-threonylcarbamoyltransferase complex dimerization subunit type 1 TsaB [Rhabdaerophilum sp. SD176]
MYLLALDTALGATSAAVFAPGEGRILAEETEPMERGHAEALMPLVRRVLDRSGIAFADLSRFAVTIGPGSFTGLRIGISAARGFGLIHQRPVVGVSTLSAFAAPILFSGDRSPVAAAIDARNGLVYFQSLAIGGRTMAGPGVYPVEEAARKIGDGPVVFVGNAAEKLAQARRGAILENRPGQRPAIQQRPSPEIAWVARLGAVADLATSPAKPLYLREANVTLQDKARLQRA